MNDVLLGKAQLLISQNRHQEAGKVLGELMAMDPNDTDVLGLYCQAMLGMKKNKEAEELINRAISLTPDDDHLHYLKSRVMISLDKFNDAEFCLQEAIEINPGDADYYAIWASIKLARKQYQEALELSDKSLSLDPANILGLNTRSTSLLKLNRKEDSFNTIEGALREDPENAYTHANYGWNLLNKGDHKKALEHFKQALRQDPNSGIAQEGMMEAIKAKYLVYRWFLMYSFWISKLTARNQWLVIIGFYLLVRGIGSLARHTPALQPFLLPLILLLVIVALSTWIISPLSNLYLRLNPYGKFLLDREDKISANFVGISALVMITGILSYFITTVEPWLAVAGFGLIMMVPLGTMFVPSKYNALLYLTIFMALIGVGGIITAFTTGNVLNGFALLFLTSFVAYQWIANFFAIKADNI